MERVLSLSYGKDSLACLEAIRLLGWPLDRIIHAEVWATETIPADLPPIRTPSVHDMPAENGRKVHERFVQVYPAACYPGYGKKLDGANMQTGDSISVRVSHCVTT